MDISTALLNLQALAGQKQLELDFLNVAISHLKGEFAPKFAELEATKAENDSLKNQNATLKSENDQLKNPKVIGTEDIIK